VLLFGATAVLALFPFSPNHSWWVRQLVKFSLLFVTLSSPLVATPLIDSLEFWYHPPQLTPSDRFDVIVVLGGTIDEKGSLRLTTEPSSYSINRTMGGVGLYRQGYAPMLVLTGGEMPEASVRAPGKRLK
jgi:hypothetical protein